MKCVICGSRSIIDYEIVEKTIKESKFTITEVVSGCAAGVDLLGEKWAKQNDIPISKFPAEWEKYGKLAGYIRNKQMVDYVTPDGCVIAVWDGISKGTVHTIKYAKEKGVKIFVKSPPFLSE